jgi:CTD kinase subunit alpha
LNCSLIFIQHSFYLGPAPILSRTERSAMQSRAILSKTVDLTQMPSTPFDARDVAMKDSWSHGDGRRDRGRVDRGVNRPRRSPSPAARRSESDREGKARGRSVEKPRSSRPKHRRRDSSDNRRRPVSRSPVADSRDEVRERNRGRELLDTRISGKPRRSDHQEHHSDKRRRSRSPSRDRTERKRSRRASSRSPVRGEDSSTSARLTRRERSPHRHRQDSSGHKAPAERAADHKKDRRASDLPEKRRHSPLPRRDRPSSRTRQSSPRRSADHRKRSRSPKPGPDQRASSRHRSPHTHSSEKSRRRGHSKDSRRRSPEVDRYAPSVTSRDSSLPGGPRGSRASSPIREKGSRLVRDEYRPGPPKAPKSSKGALKASGANSIEVNMSARGNFGQPGYHNTNQQMQAAFPLKPQFNQGRPQIDTRQYSQSPQHMSPSSSYHGSPHAHSPYSAGRGGWGGQQQQFSPQQ